MERLDKIIAHAAGVSRSDARALIKRGAVQVNGATVTDGGFQADGAADTIICDGEVLGFSEHLYLMMNKPAGVVSASAGKNHETVVDLVPEALRRRGLFPAGRLDKDTTGFVLLTDDGAFAHDILSPKKHVPKTYLATLDKPIGQTVIDGFRQGVTLGDGTVCLPAQLAAQSSDATVVRVVISQGMYHQVKRMFAAYGIAVTALHRLQIGGLPLDETLAPGECRPLTPEEVDRLVHG